MVVGDIVVAPFAYADRNRFKRRPVLLLRDVGMYDWITCEITSQRYASRSNQIDIEPADLATGDLDRPSVVRFNRLQTINEARFGTYIGRLTDEKLAEITAAVRALF